MPLAALGLLSKTGSHYSLPRGHAELLTETGGHSVLAMIRHQANCLRRWAELASVVKTGKPVECPASIRGKDADYAAFVEAMDNLARPVADRIIADLPRLSFRRVLDVGGATGSWTSRSAPIPMPRPRSSICPMCSRRRGSVCRRPAWSTALRSLPAIFMPTPCRPDAISPGSAPSSTRLVPAEPRPVQRTARRRSHPAGRC